MICSSCGLRMALADGGLDGPDFGGRENAGKGRTLAQAASLLGVGTQRLADFAERAFESGTARDDGGGTQGSMGLDGADYDGTGLPSLFVTNYEGEKHALYHNDWKPGTPIEKHFFSFRSTQTRISALGQIYVGWGTGFLDIDHHGWEDLFFTDGHAIRHPTHALTDPHREHIRDRGRADECEAERGHRDSQGGA